MNDWSPYYVVKVEGDRIGLVTCLRCGAAVLIDKDDEPRLIHERWHDEEVDVG